MIPVLFSPTATTFTSQGIGALTDAISCEVTEERNGSYELELHYPVGGAHYADIQYRSIICAIPSPYRTRQPFRVYCIEESIDGTARIYAQHISYDLSGNLVIGSFSASTASETFSQMVSHYIGDISGFSFWTDKTNSGNFENSAPHTFRGVLGGVEGSVLDVFGGEYEWDGYAVKLHDSRGVDNHVYLRYGKNLTEADATKDGTDCATAVMAYWTDSQTGATVYGLAYDPDRTYVKWTLVDVSADYDTQPTTVTLNARAAVLLSNCDSEPVPSLEVSFVDSAQTTDYAGVEVLEACDLCDTVHVVYGEVDETRKITKIVTDCLGERYTKVVVGNVRAGLERSTSGGSSGGASADVTADNIAAALGYTPGREATVLWTNPEQYSAYSGGNITVAGADNYKLLAVMMKFAAGQEVYETNIIRNTALGGQLAGVTWAENASTALSRTYRAITCDGTDTIGISAAGIRVGAYAGTGTLYAIPCAIIGIG